jgi:hypothetical protein
MSSSGWAKKSTSFGLAVGGGIDGGGEGEGFIFLEWRCHRRCMEGYDDSRGREEKGGSEVLFYTEHILLGIDPKALLEKVIF